MKKLILSAAFALVCFTANAKNEVIKNDDKKPKAKTETTKAKTKLEVEPLSSQFVCTRMFTCGNVEIEVEAVGTSLASACAAADRMMKRISCE